MESKPHQGSGLRSRIRKTGRVVNSLLSGSFVTGNIRLAVAVVLAVAAAQPAFAQRAKHGSHKKFDRGLVESLRAGAATQRVIITVKAEYRAEVRQALEKHGDRIKSEHPLVGALAVEIHSEDLEELGNHPWIEALSLDATVSAGAVRPVKNTGRGARTTTSRTSTTTTAQPTTDPGPTTTLRQTLGLPSIASFRTFTGSSGVGVAIIDSGIAPSPDFAGRITGFYDFTRDGIPVAPFDDYGHGTHIAGLIGSSGTVSNYEFQGIAPAVRLVGLKVLDSTGQGSTSNVIKAIEFVVANKARLHVQIVNLSLGHPIFAPREGRPAGAGGRAGVGGRPHRRHVGGQLRPGEER